MALNLRQIGWYYCFGDDLEMPKTISTCFTTSVDVAVGDELLGRV
jgi:hypothetical protein